MSKSAQFNITVHSPLTDEGKKELAKRVSKVYSDAVIRKINSLECRKEEKEKLLKEIMNRT